METRWRPYLRCKQGARRGSRSLLTMAINYTGTREAARPTLRPRRILSLPPPPPLLEFKEGHCPFPMPWSRNRARRDKGASFSLSVASAPCSIGFGIWVRSPPSVQEVQPRQRNFLGAGC
ncbi:hypothetical protein NL676_011230 [Syzygium grande]|nr:hypothetical protein NL676_011230 [Syzygium grande]